MTYQERVKCHIELGERYADLERLHSMLQKASDRLRIMQDEVTREVGRAEVRIEELLKMLENETVKDSAAEVPPP